MHVGNLAKLCQHNFMKGRPMTQAHMPAHLHYLASRNLTPTVTFFLTLAVLVAKWQETRRTRRVLGTMDDHILKDIGLTRHDAQKESQRPFWDI